MTPKESAIKAAQDLQRLIVGGLRWLARLLLIAAVVSATYGYLWQWSATPGRGNVSAIKKEYDGREFVVFDYRVGEKIYHGKFGPGRGQTRVSQKVGDSIDLFYQPANPKSWSCSRSWHELPTLFCFGAVVFWFVHFFTEGLCWCHFHPPVSLKIDSD